MKGPNKQEKILNLKRSPFSPKTLGSSSLSASRLFRKIPENMPANIDNLNSKQKIRNQSWYGYCVGFAISDTMTSELIKQDIRWIDRPLSPTFIVQCAKETDIFKVPSTNAGAEGTSIKAGLDIAKTYGNLYEMYSPLGVITTYNSTNMMEDAAYIKVKNIYDLLKDQPNEAKYDKLIQWLALGYQAVLGISVDNAFYNAGGGLVLNEFDFKNSLGYHALRATAYRNYDPLNPDKLEVRLTNSWDTYWGDEGQIWVTRNWLNQSMFEAWGLTMTPTTFYK